MQQLVPGPVDLYVACGMGRSYVDWSGFGVRRLPGIQSCGLWNALETDPSISSGMIPRVLITDIGNDLVYGRSPETTLGAVAECVHRIRNWAPGSDIIITGLPLKSVQTLGPARFRIARTLLFAGCTLSLPEIQRRADQTQNMLQEMAVNLGLTLIPTRREWYGVDPIHVRRSLRIPAFREILSGWQLSENPGARSAAADRIARPTAAERILFGRLKKCPQPSIEFAGHRVHAY